MRQALIGLLTLGAGACATPATAPASITAIRTPAASRADPTFVQGQPAELLISQEFILHSKNVGADYLIQVALPLPMPAPGATDVSVEAIDRMFPNHDAAVIYVLDGAQAFPAVASQRRGPQFIVGIQPMFRTLRESQEIRWRDLVHEKVKGQPASGGGAKFEAFLKEELRPFIESRFPVDPKKSVLSGYSLGGMFALRVLANDPGAFAGYLVGDPSRYDPTLSDRLRAALPKTSGQRVYLGVADSSRPADRAAADGMISALQGPGSHLVVKLQEFAGEDHVTAEPFVGQKGMAWLFSAAK